MESHLPEASITFDRFHIMQLWSKAVDTVRREEATGTDVLKRTQSLWLKNPESGDGASAGEALRSCAATRLKTARAYQIRLTLQELFAQPDRQAGEA